MVAYYKNKKNKVVRFSNITSDRALIATTKPRKSRQKQEENRTLLVEFKIEWK